MNDKHVWDGKRIILYALKKEGIRRTIYNDVIYHMEQNGFSVLESYNIYIENKHKYVEKFHYQNYRKVRRVMDRSIEKRVIALVVEVPYELKTKIHLKTKYKLRNKYGQNILHCSDNFDDAYKEITIILDKSNYALFHGSAGNRKLEDKLIKRL